MSELIGWVLIVGGFIGTGYTLGRMDGRTAKRRQIRELTEQRDSAEDLVIQAYVYGDTPEIVIPARLVKRMGADSLRRVTGVSDITGLRPSGGDEQ